MTPRHLFLALFTVVVWGMNFMAVKIALKGFPPLLLCAARFGLAALPWAFFMPRPKGPWKLILGYGLFTFVLQFGLLFTGIYLGLSAGLASLVLQVQVFFSIGLAAFFFNDRPTPWKILGSVISFIGIGIVGMHLGGSTSFIGLVLVVLASFAWGVGNMFTKKIGAESPLSLVVWGNLVAFPFMVLVSVFMEGPALIVSSISHISWQTIAAIAYIVYMSTHVGYGMWGFLLNTYPTATVVPFTLLVPIIGFLSSAAFLGEDLPFWKIVASAFVMGGLVFNLLEPQFIRLKTAVRQRF
ncbi:MAG: O-acetylserine/cysteine exporter [Chitinophagaceae bacterium]|nr:MAG: O-acetylserine/cysteine exporter [Chitinophagaceae bacterium]